MRAMPGVIVTSAGTLCSAPCNCVFGFAHRTLPRALAAYTLQGYIGRMRKDIKASCQKRLSRIEGQVRGLSRMVDEDRYCIDIVTQISAVRAALRRVEEEVLRDHVSHCVEHAIASGNKSDQREKISELMAVIGRSDR
jgi:CsoR family transcriptional regulator, copper-sensing transcriptional repressor